MDGLVPKAPDKGKLGSVRVHSGEARMGPEDSPVGIVLDQIRAGRTGRA
jgi:hypothetical protein